MESTARKKGYILKEVTLRFLFLFILVIILSIPFVGCEGKVTKNEVNSDTPKSGSASAITRENNIQEEVMIKASYEKPLSFGYKNTVFLNGLLDGEEYIEVVVKGEVFDFEQVALIWDESKNDLKEKETVKRIEKLINQTLIIKTFQPEGIPSEKLKWKSRTGKTYEYIVHERALGDTDNSTVKFDID